jgi:AAT family amino acid transporter
LNINNVPYVAVIKTTFISGLCFGASFIGAGRLWTWLENLVGVSDQLAWMAIALTSIRFRKALFLQEKTYLLPFKNWTYPWGPWISLLLNGVIILVQGWNSFSPKLTAVTFVSYYIELPVMLIMYVVWKLVKKTRAVGYEEMDLETDAYVVGEEDLKATELENSTRGKVAKVFRWIF